MSSAAVSRASVPAAPPAAAADGTRTRRGSLFLMAATTLLAVGWILVVRDLIVLDQARGDLEAALGQAALEAVPLLHAHPGWESDGGLERRIHAAWLVAREAADADPARWQGAVLRENPLNAAEGDFVVGWSETPNQADDPLIRWQGSGGCNTLLLRAARSHQRGNPLPLWIAPRLGVCPADLEVQVRAACDRRVLGFEPLAGQPAPVVPFAVLEVGGRLDLTAPATPSNDRYYFDEAVPAIFPGSDGISEVELRWGDYPGKEGPRGVLLPLALGQPGRGASVEWQLGNGLSGPDLAAFSGKLLIGQEILRRTAAAADRAVVEAFWGIRGELRAWPVVAAGRRSGQIVTYNLSGFFAGSVADAWFDDREQQLVVIVQPTPMVAETAVVGPLAEGQVPNPWIGKPYLVR